MQDTCSQLTPPTKTCNKISSWGTNTLQHGFLGRHPSSASSSANSNYKLCHIIALSPIHKLWVSLRMILEVWMMSLSRRPVPEVCACLASIGFCLCKCDSCHQWGRWEEALIVFALSVPASLLALSDEDSTLVLLYRLVRRRCTRVDRQQCPRMPIPMYDTGKLAGHPFSAQPIFSSFEAELLWPKACPSIPKGGVG